MSADDQPLGSAYALLDAGDGRRLERFGHVVVDRPAPGADAPRRSPGEWAAADLRFDRPTGWVGQPPTDWRLELGGLTVELRATETGQVGLFPEHAVQRAWLADQLARRPGASVLHLFAYTGLGTLILAAAGASVAHVDASRPAVAWARRNAALSGLDRAPVRWLVDDAAAFVPREARRGRRYGGLVLDPPAYGHGGGGDWRLERDLPPLLAAARALLEPGAFVLLTAHSVGWDPDRLSGALGASLPVAGLEAGFHELAAESGAILSLGAFARGIING